MVLKCIVAVFFIRGNSTARLSIDQVEQIPPLTAWYGAPDSNCTEGGGPASGGLALAQALRRHWHGDSCEFCEGGGIYVPGSWNRRTEPMGSPGAR